MKKSKLLFTALFLFAVTLILFSPVREFEFLNYDDDLYVTENPYVREGISLKGLKWMWKTSVISNWHPLTLFSHMMDVQLFGINPGAHHLVNVAFHSTNALLLFILLVMMTGAFWRSFFVAALFAWHPLHVESVAWISERKDVLSAFFFFLMIMAYGKYVKSKDTVNRAPAFYLLSLFLFALGLMAKPMLVTAPFVLFLLDYWPLGRFSGKAVKPLVIEKMPFFLLTVFSCFMTLLSQQDALANAQRYPLFIRLVNAVISYFEYFQKTFWPHPLAFFYPYSIKIDWVNFAVSVSILTALSIFLLMRSKRNPWGITGWFWYLGMLVPVIGIVQVGQQAMGDRYTYLPQIGIFMVLAWGGHAFFEKYKIRRLCTGVLAAALLAACLVLSRGQIAYWKTSIILYSRALQLIPNNYIAHNNLGLTLASEGKFRETMTDFIRPVTSNPEYTKAYQTLGYDVEEIKNQEAAIQRYFKAIELNPKDADAYYNLGVLFAQRKKTIQAIFYYLEALRLNPEDSDAHNNVGNIFMRQNKLTEAIYHFSEAVRIHPDYDKVWYNLGEAYKGQGTFSKAIQHYQRAIVINPDYARAYSGMADVFTLQKKREDAVSWYRKALAIDPQLEEARKGLENETSGD